jgi:hypothetical protein
MVPTDVEKLQERCSQLIHIFKDHIFKDDALRIFPFPSNGRDIYKIIVVAWLESLGTRKKREQI